MRWDDMTEEEPDTLTPAGTPQSGWWPVCQISWASEPQVFNFDEQNRTLYFVGQCSGVICIFIVCWCQLQDGGLEIQAWPVYMAPWARSRL